MCPVSANSRLIRPPILPSAIDAGGSRLALVFGHRPAIALSRHALIRPKSSGLIGVLGSTASSVID